MKMKTYAQRARAAALREIEESGGEKTFDVSTERNTLDVLSRMKEEGMIENSAAPGAAPTYRTAHKEAKAEEAKAEEANAEKEAPEPAPVEPEQPMVPEQPVEPAQLASASVAAPNDTPTSTNASTVASTKEPKRNVMRPRAHPGLKSRKKKSFMGWGENITASNVAARSIPGLHSARKLTGVVRIRAR